VAGDAFPEDDYFRNRTDSAVMDMIQASAQNLKTADDLIMDDDIVDIQDSITMDNGDRNIVIECDAKTNAVDALLGTNISTMSTLLLPDDSTTLESPNVTTSASQSVAADPHTGRHDSESAIDHDDEQRRDDEVEAAMKHAQYVGMHHGSTRAMVIRAYPRAWHVFVDTSPDTDADFEVAAIFADEPNIDQVNNAIIECIEGSELEDELVAQQMQQALEAGQLDRISELLASMGLDDLDDDDDNDPYRNMFGEDTV
jgi:hypothetical protein